MSDIKRAVVQVHRLAAMAEEDKWLNRIHPIAKLIITLLYIALTVSFSPYDAAGLLSMSVYPIVLFVAGEISIWDGLKRVWLVLPLVCCVGIFNPFFDTQIVCSIGNIGISAGVISMATLMVKGILCVFAAYLLIVSTTIEKICYALRLVHVPKLIVTVILLIYRYISLLLEETNRVVQAYALRAPGQKGIHRKAWGTLAGNLLLRSMDRAQHVYESMRLRGFNGAFHIAGNTRLRASDMIYLIFWTVLLILFRIFCVFEWVGKLLI